MIFMHNSKENFYGVEVSNSKFRNEIYFVMYASVLQLATEIFNVMN